MLNQNQTSVRVSAHNWLTEGGWCLWQLLFGTNLTDRASINNRNYIFANSITTNGYGLYGLYKKTKSPYYTKLVQNNERIALEQLTAERVEKEVQIDGKTVRRKSGRNNRGYKGLINLKFFSDNFMKRGKKAAKRCIENLVFFSFDPNVITSASGCAIAANMDENGEIKMDLIPIEFVNQTKDKVLGYLEKSFWSPEEKEELAALSGTIVQDQEARITRVEDAQALADRSKEARSQTHKSRILSQSYMDNFVNTLLNLQDRLEALPQHKVC